MEFASRLTPGLNFKVGMLGRRDPGASLSDVAEELKQIGHSNLGVEGLSASKATYFDRSGRGYKVFVAGMSALTITVFGVLAIAAVNLACLFLAQSFARQRD